MTAASADPGGRTLRSPRPLSTTRALTHVAKAKPVGNRWKRAYRTRISATDAATIAFATGYDYRRHRLRGSQQVATY
jgi:hypothetical protein